MILEGRGGILEGRGGILEGRGGRGGEGRGQTSREVS